MLSSVLCLYTNHYVFVNSYTILQIFVPNRDESGAIDQERGRSQNELDLNMHSAFFRSWQPQLSHPDFQPGRLIIDFILV